MTAASLFTQAGSINVVSAELGQMGIQPGREHGLRQPTKRKKIWTSAVVYEKEPRLQKVSVSASLTHPGFPLFSVKRRTFKPRSWLWVKSFLELLIDFSNTFLPKVGSWGHSRPATVRLVQAGHCEQACRVMGVGKMASGICTRLLH